MNDINPNAGQIIGREYKDGGLTLVLEGQLADGRVVRSTVSWNTLAEAQSNYAKNEEVFLARMEQLGADVVDDERNSLRRLGSIGSRQIVLYTSVGGDPWRIPKFRFERDSERNSLEVGAGWLKGCFFIGIGRKGTAKA